MPKILILGDTQLDSHPTRDRLDSAGKSVRFAETQMVLDGILQEAVVKGCTAMVHLGDLTEERNPDSATLSAAARFFGNALSEGMELLGIAGNHDGAIFSLSSSSLEALGLMNSKFHVFHNPTFLVFGGSRMLFLPYLHRLSPAQVMEAAVAFIPKGEKVDYVFAHYAYAGVEIGANNLVLPGDKLDSSFLHALGAKVAFFGHIHKQQVIKGDCPVVFPGSPVINDFGERNDPKGYAILDTDTGKWELFQVEPHPPVDPRWTG